MERVCKNCKNHFIWWDETSDGMVYDDGCFCGNPETSDEELHEEQHKDSCYLYGDQLVECPYFEAEE